MGAGGDAVTEHALAVDVPELVCALVELGGLVTGTDGVENVLVRVTTVVYTVVLVSVIVEPEKGELAVGAAELNDNEA